MELWLDRPLLEELVAALAEPLRAPIEVSASRYFQMARRTGWMVRPDVAALLCCLDHRLARLPDASVLASVFGMGWQNVRYRPRSRAIAGLYVEALPAASVAELLILCERCGFTTDASGLVDLLVPDLRERELLTAAELAVLRFHTSRHRYEPITLHGAPRADAVCSHQRRMRRNYVIETWLDAASAPIAFSVRAPAARSRKSATVELLGDATS